MTEAEKECSDHHLWVKNLQIAYWFSLGATLYYVIFTDSFYGMIMLFATSVVLVGMRMRSERKHYEWHLGQEKEGKHNM